MIDRTDLIRPLTERTPSDVRAILDRLHADRERYDRANRIVEVRSCDLAISEATRALAIINRRATEAEDQRAAGERALTADEVQAVIEAAFRAEVTANLGALIAVEIRRAANAAAEKLAGRSLDPEQREADLREAFVAGKEWESGRWPDDPKDVERDAAEYARSKAGA